MTEVEGNWIEIPESILARVMEQIAQLDSCDTISVPESLVDSLVEYLSEDLGCDHAVNICRCADLEAVHDLILAKAGKQTCGTCGGDSWLWTAEQYETDVQAVMKERNLSHSMAILWANAYNNDLGQQVCPTCEGAGTVTFRDEVRVGVVVPGDEYTGPHFRESDD